MALDWSKPSASRKAKGALQADGDLSRYLADHEPESAEERAAVDADMARAIAEYRGPVRRLPYIMKLKCICGHKGRVKVYPGERKRFRCSKCGFRSI